VFVVSGDEKIREIFEKDRLFFASLSSASEVLTQADREGIAEDAVSTLIHNASIFIPMEELVDIGKEIERLTKEKKRLEQELKRSRGMLQNEKFLSKAPAQKVEEEKGKLAKYEKLMEQVSERLSQLAR
jgi:valyl-tRNA synthetase